MPTYKIPAKGFVQVPFMLLHTDLSPTAMMLHGVIWAWQFRYGKDKPVSNSILCTWLHCGKDAFLAARQELADAGLVTWKTIPAPGGGYKSLGQRYRLLRTSGVGKSATGVSGKPTPAESGFPATVLEEENHKTIPKISANASLGVSSSKAGHGEPGVHRRIEMTLARQNPDADRSLPTYLPALPAPAPSARPAESIAIPLPIVMWDRVRRFDASKLSAKERDWVEGQNELRNNGRYEWSAKEKKFLTDTYRQRVAESFPQGDAFEPERPPRPFMTRASGVRPVIQRPVQPSAADTMGIKEVVNADQAAAVSHDVRDVPTEVAGLHLA
jgi:hypothetical protein